MAKKHFFLAMILSTATSLVARAQISGEIRDGKIVVLASEPTEMMGMNFMSQGGLLEPLPAHVGPAPFTFMLANTPNQITWGNLGTRVQLDGEWATQAGYTGSDPAGDLTSEWGSDASQIHQFPVSIGSGGAQHNVPDVTAPNVPEVNPPQVNPPQVVPSQAGLAVSLNGDNRFVLHASNYTLDNLAIASKSGGLVPADNAAPFPTLINNDAHKINYFSQNALTLDGDLTLSAGWQPSHNDLQVGTLVDGSYVPFHAGAIAPCVDCTKSLGVSFNDDQRFVLQGDNHQLTSLDFFSGGSLVPAASAAPFVGLESNSPTHVGYRAAEGVTIDGTVTLSSGWNANGIVGDVRYEYTDSDGNRTGRLAIANSSFAQNRHLDVIVNDDNRISLTGTGHKVNSVEFSSRSGSLVPGSSSSPFDSMGANTSNEIAFFHSDGNIVLDGEIVLDVGWNSEGERDLQFKYDGVGNSPDGGYYLSRGSYPTGTEELRPDVWISLDRDYRLILHADGKDVLGLNVESADQGLLAVASPDPFPALLSNEPERVTLGTVGTEARVQIAGSIKTDIGINPLLKPEPLSVQYGVDDTPIEVEVLAEDLAICPGCAIPEVSFDEGGQMFIEGFETSLTQIEITSASGSLVPLTFDASAFATAFSSSSEVRLAAAEGVDAFLRQALPVAWDTLGIDDVLVEFTTIEGTPLGPFELGAETYDQVVPEPNAAALAFVAGLVALGLRRRRS